MALLEFTRRSRVLGLPIGPRRTNWPTILRVGAGAVAGAASLVAARARAITPSSNGDAPTDDAPTDDSPADDGATDAQAVRYDANGRPRDEHGRFIAVTDGDDGGDRRERASGRERQAG